MPEAVGGILEARLIGVEKGAFELGPEPDRAAADRRRADEPGVGAPCRDQALDIVGRHEHVAVGEHDPVVRGGAPALVEIVELGIVADLLVADQEPRRHAGMGRHQAPDRRHHRILRRGDAEHDLVARVVEREAGSQRLLDMVLDAADRTHQAHGRRVRGRAQTAGRRFAANDRNQRAGEVDCRGGDAESLGGQESGSSCASYLTQAVTPL